MNTGKQNPESAYSSMLKYSKNTSVHSSMLKYSKNTSVYSSTLKYSEITVCDLTRKLISYLQLMSPAALLIFVASSLG